MISFLEKIRKAENALKRKTVYVPKKIDFDSLKKTKKSYIRKKDGKVVQARRVDSYQEYIKSKEWFEFRASVIKARGRRCEICHKQDQVVLHHRTYARLGFEEQKDLILL